MKRKHLPLYIILCIAVILITLFMVYLISNTPLDDNTSTSSVSLYLKSYENTVALYEGENIKEVFPDVVLNSLPIKDRNSLNSGILIESEEQLQSLLEDFDG